MIAKQYSPNYEGIRLPFTNRVALLTSAATCLPSKRELLGYAHSLLTSHEQEVLARFRAYSALLGEETAAPRQDELTTREKMVIAWYSDMPKADAAALMGAFRFVDQAAAIWDAQKGRAS